MRRCSRCSTYFSDEQQDRSCTYHPYPWLDVHTPGKGVERIGVWTCCREVTHSAPGCTRGTHIEDIGTSEILKQFEVMAVRGTREQALELLDTEFLMKNLGSKTKIHYMDHNIDQKIQNTNNNNINNNVNFSGNGNNGNSILSSPSSSSITSPVRSFAPSRGSNKSPRQEQVLAEGFIRYTIQTSDTLQGVAIRHKTTVAVLKQLNKLFSDHDIHKLKTLVVPDPNYNNNYNNHKHIHSFLSSPEEVQKFNVKKFASREGVCNEEALFYLSDNNWDVERAKESFIDDAEWARETERAWKRQREGGRVKEFLGDTDVQTVAIVTCGAIIVLLCILL